MKNIWILILSLPVLASAAPWSGIIDPSRAVDWSSFAGIPGGAPNRTTICTTLSASTFGNGASDATAAIQNALNNCAASGVVLLSAGTFRINTGFNIPSNVVLRGAGPDQTILSLYDPTSPTRITMGNNNPFASTAINGSPVAGSTSFAVADPSLISAGMYILVTQLNDPSVPVTANGTGGVCGWCGGNFGAERLRTQIVEVTSVNGTTIGFFPPLFTTYQSALSPLAYPFTMQKYSGIENLRLYSNNTNPSYGSSTNTSDVTMQACAYCWVKNVEGNYADGDHVRAFYSFRGEIRDSYFHDSFAHLPGQSEGDIFIALNTTGFLIENNILRRQHLSVLLNWGVAGNVVAYNFMDGNFDSRRSTDTMFLEPGTSMHGAHPSFNLFEGNVEPGTYLDMYWGSSSHNTYMRNHMKGTTQVCGPIADGVRGVELTGPANCAMVYSNARAASIENLARYVNLVGNVLSSTDQLNLYSAANEAPLVVSPTFRNWNGSAYGYDFGYNGSGEGGTTSATDNTDPSFTTAFIYGDFNRINGQVLDSSGGAYSWNAAPRGSIPASFYRSSKPAWFGNVPWPPIGPDVTGGAEAGHVNMIPAQICFNSSSRDSVGNVIFNAQRCYGSGSAIVASLPAKPAGLTVK